MRFGNSIQEYTIGMQVSSRDHHQPGTVTRTFTSPVEGESFFDVTWKRWPDKTPRRYYSSDSVYSLSGFGRDQWPYIIEDFPESKPEILFVDDHDKVNSICEAFLEAASFNDSNGNVIIDTNAFIASIQKKGWSFNA